MKVNVTDDAAVQAMVERLETLPNPYECKHETRVWRDATDAAAMLSALRQQLRECREDAGRLEGLLSAEIPFAPTEKMLLAMHDGPLGGGEESMGDKQREWLTEMWQAGYAAAIDRAAISAAMSAGATK